jgi:hypothetical protein
MTEDQMMARSENPLNFAPEFWKEMQEAKAKLKNAGEGLIKVLETPQESSQGLLSPAQMISKEDSARKKRPKKGMKKSDWMRS